MGLSKPDARRSQDLMLWLVLFGVRVRDNVKHWEGKPLMQVASVLRSYAEFEAQANRLRSIHKMAKTNSKQGEWQGFINIRLTREQLDQYEQWDIHDEEVWDALAAYLETGYKMSLTYIGEQGHFNCTLSGKEAAGKNAGYAVTSYAKDIYNAIRVALFKVSVVLPVNWKDYKPSDTDVIG